MNSATTPEQAYRALMGAADRIGAGNFAALPGRTRQRVVAVGFVRAGVRGWPSRAHRDVIAMSTAVLTGAASVVDAVALLHREDVMAESFGDWAWEGI